MISLLSKIWKLLNKRVQWYSIWLIHSKFNVGLSIIIPNTEGQILLAEHVFSGPESWRLVGGYINKNENIYSAAKREIKEELGIDIEIDRVLRIRSGFMYRIEITLVSKSVDIAQEFLINKKEIKQIGWFKQGEEPEDTLDSHKDLLVLYKEKPVGYVEIKNL